MIEFLQTVLPLPLSKQGKLNETPAYIVLLALERDHFTGKVFFERETRKKKIYLHQGNLVLARSNLVAESLIEIFSKYILPSDVIQKIQVELSVETKGETSESKLIQRLLSSKQCTYDQIEQARRIQREEILLNLFGWFEGEYHVEEAQLKNEFSSKVQPSSWLHYFFENVEHGEPSPFVLSEGKPLPNSGDLRALGGPHFLLKLIQQKTMGQVILERPDKRKLLWMDTGKVTTISSTHPQETLPEILHRFRYLPEKKIEEAIVEAEKTKKRLREILIQKKLLKDGEVLEAIQILHFERILEILAWRSGKYRIQGNATVTTQVPTIVLVEKKKTLTKANIQTIEKMFGTSVTLEENLQNVAPTTFSQIIFWIRKNKTSRNWVESTFQKLPTPLQQQASFVFEEEASDPKPLHAKQHAAGNS